MRLIRHLNESDYLTEADIHETLWKRYLKVLDRALKIHNSMNIQATELKKIQKQMKKVGLDAIENKMGQPVFTVDENTDDRIRSMVLEQ